MSILIRKSCNELNSSDFDQLAKTVNDGGVIIAAADTVYGFVSKAFDSLALHQLDNLKGNRQLPYAVVFGNKIQFLEWHGELDLFRRRIVDRLFPGPVSLVLPTPAVLRNKFRYGDDGVSVRVCSETVLTELAVKINSPLWATSANRSAEPSTHQLSDIDPTLLSAVQMIVDTGPTLYKEASTVIDLRKYPFNVLRSGPWMTKVNEALDYSRKPLKVLSVCTGNICRSPLLMEILRHHLADLPVEIDSAGTYAGSGNPATRDMIDIAAEWGMSLRSHLSRPIVPEDLEIYDLILVAESEHKDYITQFNSNSVHKVHLAAEIVGKESIPDPYGNSSTYYAVSNLLKPIGVKWAEYLREMIQKVIRSEINVSTASTADSTRNP